MQVWSTLAAGNAPFTAFDTLTWNSMVFQLPNSNVVQGYEQKLCDFWEAFFYEEGFPGIQRILQELQKALSN